MKAVNFDIQRFVELSTVKFGGNNATVSVSSGITVTNGTLASGSNGNDTLMSSHDMNYSPFYHYSKSVVSLGSGNDYVDIDGEIGWGIGHSSVTINCGSEDDTVNIIGNQNVIFTSSVSINGGNGNDYINLGNYEGTFDYGTDIIGLTSTFIVEGGSGKDTIKIASNNNNGISGVGDVYDGSEIAYPSSVYIKGGDDDDQITIYGKRVGISASKEITISGGTGNDLISISGDTYGISQSTLPIDGGNGVDTITVNSIANWSAVSIIAGSGDVISVGSGEATYLFDSTDAVTINGATFKANASGSSTNLNSSPNSTSIKSAWNGTVSLSGTKSLADIDGNIVSVAGNYSIVDGKFSSSSDINSSINSETTTITSPTISTNNNNTSSQTIPANNSMSSGSAVTDSSVKSIYEFYRNVNETISAGGTSSVNSNYTVYEQVTFHTEFRSFELSGNNLLIYSSSGSLTITNVRGQTMAYANADGNPIAHSYVASSSGTIDRRDYSQFEVVIGADNVNNQIYAGDGGSNLWGGYGGNDTMTGAAGYDEFNYKIGSGNDVVQNAGDNDIVNLNNVSMSDIVSANVSSSEISATFNDGGSLKVMGNSKVGFLVEGVTYYVSNRYLNQWSTK